MSAAPASIGAWFAAAFAAALAAQTALRWWLSTRQIAAMAAGRERVPAAFARHIRIDDQRKAADYTAARARLARVAAGVDAGVKLALTFGGGLAAIDAAVARRALAEPWAGLVVICAVYLLLELVALPFAVWRTFALEARFGFNRSTPRLFVADRVRELALAALLGAPLALATLAIMRNAGALWWLEVWFLWIAVSVALTWAAPRYLAPLFNRFTPLEDPLLARRVAELLERCGFRLDGAVYVMDGSRRSAHGNAYFTGIGRHKRIVLFDTLVARLSPAEIEAVLAHELGHYRLHHVRRHLVLSVLATGAGLAALAWLARQPGFYAEFGLAGPSAAGALVLFALTVPTFAYLAKPLRAWWSRRHEFEADDFAAAHAPASDLATALVALYRDNATALEPDPLHSAFYDTHPPATVRIARLEARGASRAAGVASA